MFGESTRWYDEIYSWLDYEKSTERLRALIADRCPTPGKTLLDIACGSGKQLEQFRGTYEVAGLDLDPQMLELARSRLPGVPLHNADFCDFDLGEQFDVILNMFSSIGYAGTRERLDAAIACVARHLSPGGVALIEPWFLLENYSPGNVHMLVVDKPELKISRVNRSEIDGNRSVIHFHYLVATPEDGVRHFTEHHELTMFTVEDFAEAGAAYGLTHEHLAPEGFPRGMHIFKHA